jgi:hypothetical protein
MAKRFVSIADRIRAGIVIDDHGCWLWQGDCKTNNGYGRIEIKRRNPRIRILAHRASYAAFIGPIPDGLNVLHECDVPSCCNPDHLFLGTLSDNVKDCIAKGRLIRKRGESSPISVLTQSTARDLRPRSRFYGDISAWAREFCVSRRTIRLLLRNETYKEEHAIARPADDEQQ